MHNFRFVFKKCNDHSFLFDLLQSKEEKHFINNHLTFTVKFHKDPETDSSRIVGFEVKPFRSYLLFSHHLIHAYWC